MQTISSSYKYLSSFLKTHWELEDYPVRFVRQHQSDASIPTWSVQIVNWVAMRGEGETKSEAYSELRRKLRLAYESRENMPRPGEHVPIEIVSTSKQEELELITNLILREVLGINPKSVLVSDETSLWDFNEGHGIAVFNDKIYSVFGVHVSHIASGNIVELARYISEKR